MDTQTIMMLHTARHGALISVEVLSDRLDQVFVDSLDQFIFRGLPRYRGAELQPPRRLPVRLVQLHAPLQLRPLGHDLRGLYCTITIYRWRISVHSHID